jgi:hypothetical protein
MKIAFLGNFQVDFTSESHYAKTFEKLGHQVIRMQEPRVTTDDVYRIAMQCDMFFWVHTHGWDLNGNRTMQEVLRRLDRANIPTVAYHLDLYMGLRRWTEYEDSAYFKVKHFFTVDKLMADWLNENTSTIGHYLPAGVFEDECYIGEYDPRFDFDVVFVGSRRYHNEWQYRPQLIAWLEQTYGRRFGHFGNDGIMAIRGKQLNDLYATAKVVVGDTLCLDFKYPHYWSDRIYETTGRGGFMVHPYITGIETQFSEVNEVMFYQYGNFEHLKKIIDTALANSTARKQIQMAGHERTKRDHTYTNRLQTIIETVKGKS